MAQNFRRYTINAVGTVAQDVPTGANFPAASGGGTGYHTIISIINNTRNIGFAIVIISELMEIKICISSVILTFHVIR